MSRPRDYENFPCEFNLNMYDCPLATFWSGVALCNGIDPSPIRGTVMETAIKATRAPAPTAKKRSRLTTLSRKPTKETSPSVGLPILQEGSRATRVRSAQAAVLVRQ